MTSPLFEQDRMFLLMLRLPMLEPGPSVVFHQNGGIIDLRTSDDSNLVQKGEYQAQFRSSLIEAERQFIRSSSRGRRSELRAYMDIVENCLKPILFHRPNELTTLRGLISSQDKVPKWFANIRRIVSIDFTDIDAKSNIHRGMGKDIEGILMPVLSIMSDAFRSGHRYAVETVYCQLRVLLFCSLLDLLLKREETRELKPFTMALYQIVRDFVPLHVVRAYESEHCRSGGAEMDVDAFFQWTMEERNYLEVFRYSERLRQPEVEVNIKLLKLKKRYLPAEIMRKAFKSEDIHELTLFLQFHQVGRRLTDRFLEVLSLSKGVWNPSFPQFSQNRIKGIGNPYNGCFQTLIAKPRVGKARRAGLDAILHEKFAFKSDSGEFGRYLMKTMKWLLRLLQEDKASQERQEQCRETLYNVVTLLSKYRDVRDPYSTNLQYKKFRSLREFVGKNRLAKFVPVVLKASEFTEQQQYLFLGRGMVDDLPVSETLVFIDIVQDMTSMAADPGQVYDMIGSACSFLISHYYFVQRDDGLNVWLKLLFQLMDGLKHDVDRVLGNLAVVLDSFFINNLRAGIVSTKRMEVNFVRQLSELLVKMVDHEFLSAHCTATASFVMEKSLNCIATLCSFDSSVRRPRFWFEGHQAEDNAFHTSPMRENLYVQYERSEPFDNSSRAAGPCVTVGFTGLQSVLATSMTKDAHLWMKLHEARPGTHYFSFLRILEAMARAKVVFHSDSIGSVVDLLVNSLDLRDESVEYVTSVIVAFIESTDEINTGDSSNVPLVNLLLKRLANSKEFVSALNKLNVEPGDWNLFPLLAAIYRYFKQRDLSQSSMLAAVGKIPLSWMIAFPVVCRSYWDHVMLCLGEEVTFFGAKTIWLKMRNLLMLMCSLTVHENASEILCTSDILALVVHCWAVSQVRLRLYETSLAYLREEVQDWYWLFVGNLMAEPRAPSWRPLYPVALSMVPIDRSPTLFEIARQVSSGYHHGRVEYCTFALANLSRHALIRAHLFDCLGVPNLVFAWELAFYTSRNPSSLHADFMRAGANMSKHLGLRSELLTSRYPIVIIKVLTSHFHLLRDDAVCAGMQAIEALAAFKNRPAQDLFGEYGAIALARRALLRANWTGNVSLLIATMKMIVALVNGDHLRNALRMLKRGTFDLLFGVSTIKLVRDMLNNADLGATNGWTAEWYFATVTLVLSTVLKVEELPELSAKTKRLRAKAVEKLIEVRAFISIW